MTTKKSPAAGVGLVGFLRQVRAELVQVTWPTKQQVINLTAVVIGVSIVVGTYLGILDYFFVQLTGLIIG